MRSKTNRRNFTPSPKETTGTTTKIYHRYAFFTAMAALLNLTFRDFAVEMTESIVAFRYVQKCDFRVYLSCAFAISIPP